MAAPLQQPLCTNLSFLVFQKQASSGPGSSHCMPTCMQACGVSQQSTEGNCNGVWVWGLKFATISPSLVTPGTRTSLLPFHVSSSRRVPFSSIQPYPSTLSYMSNTESEASQTLLIESMVIACGARSCTMSGQKSRHHACSETWLGPRFPY